MTNWDIEYLKLCRRILAEGIEVENRTGINTVKIPSYDFTLDIKDVFPILTTKQMFSRQAIIEMLWIWQMGSNDVRDLHERNVHIWDEWMVDEDGIYRIYEPAGEYEPDKEVEVIDPLSVPVSDPFGLRHEFKPKLDNEGKIMTARSLIEGKTIKAAKYFGKEYAYTIGTAYGYVVNKYEHTRNLIDTLKKNPTDRRIVKSLWQDELLRTAVLPSCVWSTMWDVTDGALNLSVIQRSCDVPLGLPFNVTQYATLLSMIAKQTDLEPGQIKYLIKDAHIYVNQISGILTQLERQEKFERMSRLSVSDLQALSEIINLKMSLPSITDEEKQILDSELRMIDMILNPTTPELHLADVEDFFHYDNSKELRDIKVKKYKHMGKIRFPIAQ